MVSTHTNGLLGFTVLGRPAPQGSKKIGPHGQMHEASRFLSAWRDRVRLAAMRARIAVDHDRIDGPVHLSITFFLDRPAEPANPDYPIGPPDLDKLTRAVCDALKQAGVYRDDSRVVSMRVEKVWASAGTYAGALIQVMEK